MICLPKPLTEQTPKQYLTPLTPPLFLDISVKNIIKKSKNNYFDYPVFSGRLVSRL